MSSNKRIAVVIAECFQPKTGYSSALHPLIVPESPVALLRVCDVCLIDYVLEALVLNGIQTVYIVLSSSYHAVLDHLQTVRSSRGKAWVDCREMEVRPVESSRTLYKLFDAVEEVVHCNIIPEDASFLWMPIDTLITTNALSDAFAHHNQRSRTISKYAATMLCYREDLTLKTALEQAVMECGTDDTESAVPSVAHDEPPMTPVTHSVSPAEFTAPKPPAGPPPSASDAYRMIITYSRSTQVVSGMHRCELKEGSDSRERGGDEDLVPPFTVAVSKKDRIAVRSDLLYSGVFIGAPGALSTFKFFHNETFDVFSWYLTNYEIDQNVFGVEVLPGNSVVLPIHSVPQYVFANWSVMHRLLYPMTRESNFADQRQHYAVSHETHTMYLATQAGVPAQRKRHANVVLGPHSRIPDDGIVRRSVIGSNVTIGPGCTIDGCVIGDFVTIGAGCTLRDSVICSASAIGDRIHISNFSVIGSGVKIATSKPSMYVNGARVERCQLRDADASAVGDLGQGRLCSASELSRIPPLVSLFETDPVAMTRTTHEDDDTDASDDEDAQHAAFRNVVEGLVDMGIRYPSRIENQCMEFREVRNRHGMKNGDLAKTVLELLLEKAMEKAAREEADVDDRQQQSATASSALSASALDIAKAWIAQWCRPFFKEFVRSADDMEFVLIGMCTAVADPKCLLHAKASKLLEWIHNACDDDLYDEREYCIVSAEAVLAFDDFVASLEESEENGDELDDEDRAVMTVGGLCLKFIEAVRKFAASA